MLYLYLVIILYVVSFVVLKFLYNKKIKSNLEQVNHYLEKDEKIVCYTGYSVSSVYLMSLLIVIGIFLVVCEFKFDTIMCNVGIYWLLYYMVTDLFARMLVATNKSIIFFCGADDLNEKTYYSRIEALSCYKSLKSAITIRYKDGTKKSFYGLSHGKKFCKCINDEFLNNV